MSVLVDTSVLIDFLRGKTTKATRYLESIVDDGFFLTPLVLQEILQGAKDQKEFKLLKEYLGTQEFCHPLDPISTGEAAARIYFDCRRMGLTLRSTVDCLIAQIAIDNDLRLLHDDRDFDKIVKVAKLRIAL